MSEPYFRTVLVVEVLTATQAWNGDLSELGEDVTSGEASGTVLTRVVEQCSEAEIADLLKAQGSDPSFLITTWAERDPISERFPETTTAGELLANAGTANPWPARITVPLRDGSEVTGDLAHVTTVVPGTVDIDLTTGLSFGPGDDEGKEFENRVVCVPADTEIGVHDE